MAPAKWATGSSRSGTNPTSRRSGRGARRTTSSCIGTRPAPSNGWISHYGSAARPQLATAVGVGAAVSVACVIVAEFLALARLGHALTGRPVALWSRVLAVVLVAGAAASLADPIRVYDDLFKPSLVALWLAQLVVFVVYPQYAARLHGRRARDLVLAGAASALMLFGLWSTIVNQLPT